MKKLLIAVAVFMLAVSCLMFTACGGVEGTYKMSYMEIDGTRYYAGTVVDGQYLSEEYVTLEMKSDKTCIFSQMGYPINGTWEKVDDKNYKFLIPEPEDETGIHEVNATVDGKTITVDMGDGMVVCLVKK